MINLEIVQLAREVIMNVFVYLLQYSGVLQLLLSRPVLRWLQ